MKLIDSHCHLNFPELAADLPGVLARAAAAGVEVMQTICTGLAQMPVLVELIEEHPQLFASVGVHPCHVTEGEAASVENLSKFAAHPKIIGLGETGLDYYREGLGTRDAQISSLQAHITVARATKLPLIIHTRDAEDDTIAILGAAMLEGPFTAVIHCFTGSKTLAEAMLAHGFYISASGIVTFKNAQDLQAIIATVPLERLLIETDAPYLAPAPMRGKPNEPAYVAHTARFIAELRGISYAELAAVTTANFYQLFWKAKGSI